MRLLRLARWNKKQLGFAIPLSNSASENQGIC